MQFRCAVAFGERLGVHSRMMSTKTGTGTATLRESALGLIAVASSDETHDEERQRRFLAYQERKREQREERGDTGIGALPSSKPEDQSSLPN
jgi:hypothetical protein